MSGERGGGARRNGEGGEGVRREGAAGARRG